MELERETKTELTPLNPIRVETALSRYPVHRLAKKGNTDIEIRRESQVGDMAIKWEVSHNSKDGQPGPLAYKLDTLIINRRIEETARPISRIIRLGSLREITEELGLATHNDKIKKSLHQNASTYIKAKIRYKLSDGTEKDLEAGFTRYSVVFTGEKLPNGRKADAVYIVLNDVYMQVINGAMTRPLDYEYLKELAPGPQRFYEILSFQMYAAIRNDRPRAKLLYSEFCIYAPMTRHTEWTRVRSQMAKLHRPHKASGYIARIDYEQTTDGDGRPDWIMLYQPGPKARAEYRAFTKRGGPVMLEAAPFRDNVLALDGLQQPVLPLAEPEPSPLEAELIGHGITPVKAAELARRHDATEIALKIEYLEYEQAKKPGKIADPAAWLYTAIRDGRGKPKGFISRADRESAEEVRRQLERAELESRRREREAESRERAERAAVRAYWESLTSEQQGALQAAADAQADPAALALERGPLKRLGRQIRREAHIRQLLQVRHPEAGEG